MHQFRSSLWFAALLILLCSTPTDAATIVVNVATDGGGAVNQCELRDAITAANSNASVDGCVAGSGADQIVFSLPTTTITLAAALPTITQSLEIRGPGIDLLVIDGAESHNIFSANFTNGFLTLRKLELFRGSNTGGGCLNISGVTTILIEDVRINSCISTSSGGGGANIFSVALNSTAVLRRLIVKDSSAFQGGGGIVIVANNLRVEDSMFQGNQSNQPGSSGGGLGIGGSGHSVITRTTFAENQSDRKGAAINIYNANATVHIEHSTITQNISIGTDVGDEGGAIASIATLSLFNTVVAGNKERNTNHNNSDFSSSIGSLSSQGFNFIGSNQGAAAIFPEGVQLNGDRAGIAANARDAMLESLEDNGGPTLSLMPMAGSDLINKGSCPGETRDQRGYGNNQTGLRPVFIAAPTPPLDGCDTGAVEYMAQPPSELVFDDGFESSL